MAYKEASSGKWVGSIIITDNFNKRLRKRKYGFKTKKDAEAWESSFNVVEFEQKKYTSINEMCDLFLSGKKGTVDSQTLKKDATIINLHIIPHLNDFDMSKLNQATIINYRNELLEKGLSNDRVNRCVKMLKQIFKLYKSIVNAPNDPFLNIQHLRYEKQTPIQFYTLEQFHQFYKVIDSLVYKAMFRLMFFSGARSGELSALTWNDVDFKKGLINIDKSIDFKIKGVEYQIKPPKTKKSKRKVLLDKSTVELLEALKTDYKVKVKSFNDDMFVFGAMTPIKPTTKDRHNRLYAEKAGLPRIRIHDFRHSHATMLLNMNSDKLTQTNMFLVVSKRLGHKDVNETLRTYGHLIKANEEVLINVLNEFE